MTLNARESAQPISQVEYTVDNRPEVQSSAARLYSSFINERRWGPSSLLASQLSFEGRTNPRLQMADMIAREGMKDLNRLVGPVNFPERRSKIALAKDNHFRFIVLGGDDFERERAKVAVLERDGSSAAAYYEWLQRKGAQDTWDNKARFLAQFERNHGRHQNNLAHVNGEVLTAAPPHPGSPSVTFRLVRPTNAGTKNARSLARSASPRGCPLGGRYDGAKVHASSLPHRCCLVLRPA